MSTTTTTADPTGTAASTIMRRVEEALMRAASDLRTVGRTDMARAVFDEPYMSALNHRVADAVIRIRDARRDLTRAEAAEYYAAKYEGIMPGATS